MGYVLAGSLSLLLIACGSADDEGDLSNVEKRCLRMRDHLIDVRLQSTTADVPGADAARAGAIAAQHREALTAALGEDFARRCASSMSVAEIDCVLGADDNEAVTACNTKR